MGTQQTKLLLPFSQEVLLASLKSGGGRDVPLLTPGLSVEDLGACKQPCCWLLPSALLFLLKRVKSVVLQQTWKKGKMFLFFFVYKLHAQHAVVKCTVSVWHLVLKSWHRSFAGCSDTPGSGGGRGSAAALSAAWGGRSLPAAVSSCSSRPLLVPLAVLCSPWASPSPGGGFGEAVPPGAGVGAPVVQEAMADKAQVAALPSLVSSASGRE